MSAGYDLPPSGGALTAASQWVTDLLQGQAVTAIAVLAVAFLGFEMLSGRISLKNALRVVLGCFIFLGSATIAQGFMDASRGALGGPVQVAPYVSAPAAAAAPALAYPPPNAPPRTSGNPFDPYASTPPRN
jgi:type IV secretory pathway VirB2 component (pilin)